MELLDKIDLMIYEATLPGTFTVWYYNDMGKMDHSDVALGPKTEVGDVLNYFKKNYKSTNKLARITDSKGKQVWAAKGKV